MNKISDEGERLASEEEIEKLKALFDKKYRIETDQDLLELCSDLDFED